VDTYSNNYEGTHKHQDALNGMVKELKTMSGSKVKLGDVFSNAQLDLGFGTNDPTIQSIYPQARTLTWNLQRIEAVMRADPFFTRALEYRSTKPIASGIDISSDDLEAERISDLQDNIEETINPALKDALYDGDAFGWSAVLIMIDGHLNKAKLRTPLRPEEITKDSFMGLKPLVRWYQVNPEHKMISQLGKRSELYDPRLLGTPLYYKVSFDGDKGNTMRVHRSRLIIVERNKLSYIEKKVEHYGGTSLLEQAFESMSNYHTLIQQVQRTLQKSVIPVLKLEDMASTAMVNEKVQDQIQRKIDTMRTNLSANNLFVLGDGDSLEFEQVQLQGFKDLITESRKELCASLETPPEEIFHDKFDGDVKFSDNGFIENRQKFKVKPFYKKVIPILYKSLYGEEMPDYRITFKPTENPTIQEIADARKTNAESIVEFYKAGIFNKKSAQDMLADIDSNPSDIFRNLDSAYRNMGSDVDYNSDQIELAKALNQNDGKAGQAKQQGSTSGGDPKDTKKPTPRVPIKTDKGKEG